MRKILGAFLIASVIIVGVSAPAPAQSTDPISVLKSDASFKDKEAACRQLSKLGTVEAVPALAALLGDEKLSHIARYALEPMPFPEAGKALRDALGTTSGRVRVGIVESLAVRKDEQAVPELVKLLPGDSELSLTVARALGVIATPEAEKALEDGVAQGSKSSDKWDALCDGLLGCAEKLAQQGRREDAVRIYDILLRVPNALPQVQTAALRGVVLNRGAEQGLPLLVERLGGENDDAFEAALRISRELHGKPGVAAALTGALPNASAERKVQILSVFGDGDGDAAGEAVLALANEGPDDVRVAALHAVTRMRYSPSLKLITQLAWSAEGKIADAARNSLAYFPGKDGDAALEGMLQSDEVKARRVAIELVGLGGLENPRAPLMKAAETDTDESIRVAALEGLHSYAGLDEMPKLIEVALKTTSDPERHAAESTLAALCERQKQMPSSIVVQKAVYGDLPNGPTSDVLDKVSRIVAAGSPSIEATNSNFGEPAPGVVKKLRVDYTENGVAFSKTVNELETLNFASATTPPAIVDAFYNAFVKAQGEAKLTMLRLLGAAGGSKAFDAVRTAVSTGDAAMKDAAVHTLCNWQTPDALPAVMDLAKTSTDDSIKALALRGAVRLVGQSGAAPDEVMAHYKELMGLARTADDRKLVLSGLAQAPAAAALDLALAQFGDASVKAEAVQAAIAIAKKLGAAAAEDKTFFSGKDLAGWQGNTKYWRFEDGAIVGQSTEQVAQNEFLWSGAEVSDFYLVLDIMLEPNTGNAGVQFRSKKVDERGQALGYQGDVGQDCWGRLYHEHGRGKLDWADGAEKAVKPGQWNHYEILAVGPAIWIAINGKLGAAYLEKAGEGERTGLIAVQLHAGAPQTARYRFQKLVRNPKIELEGIGPKDLIAALKMAEK